MNASTRIVKANSLEMRSVEVSNAPLLLLCHGWPERSSS